MTQPMFADHILPPIAKSIPEDPDVYEARRRDMTLWENPTDKEVRMRMYVGLEGAPRQKYTPAERLSVWREYIIGPHKTEMIPSNMDRGIQDIRCAHYECALKSRECKSPDHPHTIVAGLGPRLINRGMRSVPLLAPALDDNRAALEERQKTVDQLKLQQLTVADQLAAEKAQLAALLAEKNKVAATLAALNDEIDAVTAPPPAGNKAPKKND